MMRLSDGSLLLQPVSVSVGTTAVVDWALQQMLMESSQHLPEAIESIKQSGEGTGNPTDMIQYQNMKADLLRQELSVKPIVEDTKLKNIVDDLYKGQLNPEHTGNGTTMDAIRNELLTDEPTAGLFHSIKGEEYSTALKNLLNTTTDLNSSDIDYAKKLLQDLTNALNGK